MFCGPEIAVVARGEAESLLYKQGQIMNISPLNGVNFETKLNKKLNAVSVNSVPATIVEIFGTALVTSNAERANDQQPIQYYLSIFHPSSFNYL